MTQVAESRKICSVDGCGRLARNKGYSRGKIRYDHVCGFHHSGKLSDLFFNIWGTKRIPNTRCELCGWDKAPCDRHRIIPEKGYTKENVMILCPNCHRIETINQLKRNANKIHSDN